MLDEKANIDIDSFLRNETEEIVLRENDVLSRSYIEEEKVQVQQVKDFTEKRFRKSAYPWVVLGRVLDIQETNYPLQKDAHTGIELCFMQVQVDVLAVSGL